MCAWSVGSWYGAAGRVVGLLARLSSGPESRRVGGSEVAVGEIERFSAPVVGGRQFDGL